MNYFNPKTAAERYSKWRPDFHSNTIKHIKDYLHLDKKLDNALDVACGTGLSTKALLEIATNVYGTDTSQEMLNLASQPNKIHYSIASAEQQPFADNSFDLLTISFGLRNVTDKDAALASMFRVLKPGGRLLILEFSKPVFEPFSKLYDLYSFTALPIMGKLVANDSESYKYLAESIRMHPDQRTLKGMMENAGFQNCDYHNLTAGIVAVHRGFKL